MSFRFFFSNAARNANYERHIMDSVHYEDEMVEVQQDESATGKSTMNDFAGSDAIPEAGKKSIVIPGGPWNKDIWNRDIGSNNNRDQLGSRQQEEGRSNNTER